MAISKKLRFEIFKRDGFKCRYCGRMPPQVILNADHILAVSCGGKDQESNLVTSCFDCNSGKSNRPVAMVPLGTSLEMANEQISQMKALEEVLSESRKIKTEASLRVFKEWHKRAKTMDRVRAGYGVLNYEEEMKNAVKKFLNLLVESEVMDAVDIAFERIQDDSRDYDRFKFFCGTCWRKIKSKQEVSDVR